MRHLKNNLPEKLDEKKNGTVVRLAKNKHTTDDEPINLFIGNVFTVITVLMGAANRRHACTDGRLHACLHACRYRCLCACLHTCICLETRPHAWPYKCPPNTCHATFMHWIHSAAPQSLHRAQHPYLLACIHSCAWMHKQSVQTASPDAHVRKRQQAWVVRF